MQTTYVSGSTDGHEELQSARNAAEGVTFKIGWKVLMEKCSPKDALGFLFQAHVRYNEGPGKPSAGYTITTGNDYDVNAVLLAYFPHGEFGKVLEELTEILGTMPDVVPVHPAHLA